MRNQFKIILFITSFIFINCQTQKPNSNQNEIVKNFPSKISAYGNPKYRIDLTVKRLLSNEPFSSELIIEDVARRDDYLRRFEEYEGDISGRYIGALSIISRVTGKSYPKLKEIAEEILKYQYPDGHFGKDLESKGWDYWGRQMWGHARLLTGLAEYAMLTKEEKFKSSAESLADYLIKSINRWDTSKIKEAWYPNYTNVIESFMKMYIMTEDEKYIEAAQKVVPLIPGFGAYHSHGYLISLVGLCDLYSITGNCEYIRKVENIYWRSIIRKGVYPDFSVPEWFPLSRRTEGCSIVDWMRLNLALWKITDNAEYLETAEKILYNALFFNQTANGMFGHATYTEKGYNQLYSESWWCCTMHGLYGFAEFLQYIITSDKNGISVNFYTPCEITLPYKEKEFKLKIETVYPGNGNVKIKLTSVEKEKSAFNIRLRIPLWAESFECSVNGKKLDTTAKDSYINISRKWNLGNEIELNIPLKIRLENPKNIDFFNVWNILTTRSFSEINTIKNGLFFYGPLLLVSNDFFGRIPNKCTIHSLEVFDRINPSPKKIINKNLVIPGTHFYLDSKYTDSELPLILVPIGEETAYSQYGDKLENFFLTGEKPTSTNRHSVGWFHLLSLIRK